MDDEVTLRAVEDADLDTLFEQQADPEAAAMAAFPSRERAQFDAHWARVRAADGPITRTILAGGVVAGNIGCWPDDGQWMVGYWIGREHWGRGVATRALELLVREVPARPIVAHVAAGNIGSMRVLQKVGFRRDLEREAAEPEPEDGVEEHIYVLSD